MRAPVVSARGSVGIRGLLLVSLTGADGITGYGEAAPLHSYDGVGLDEVRRAVEDCRELLAADDGGDPEALIAECRRAAVLPQAVAALDLAVWDLAGRRAGQPVWRLLGAERGAAIEVNATIAGEDRATAASEAGTAHQEGFRCAKVKVGIGDDAGRLAAVRALAGPDMQLRIDANGAWGVQEALASLRALEPVGIELCEEPVTGIEAVAEVSGQTLVPIAIDESTALPGALDTRACDAACLKIARSGGISGLLDAAGRARRAGYEVYLASTYDGPLGIAAALHAAAVLGPDRPCGLATLGLFADRDDPLPAHRGRIALPEGPGLGPGLTDWYRPRQ